MKAPGFNQGTYMFQFQNSCSVPGSTCYCVCQYFSGRMYSDFNSYHIMRTYLLLNMNYSSLQLSCNLINLVMNIHVGLVV